MRKIFLFMMVTLDGYFEGEDRDISWHNAGNKEFEDFAHEQNNSMDTILFGKRTYDLMASFWPTAEGRGADKATADWMDAARKVVVSSEPFVSTWQNVTVISENVADEIRKIKQEPGTDIALLGSNMLCVSLMEEGLVDEFRIMVNPVAIGKGTQLFAGLKKRMNFKLGDTRKFESGNILNTYTL